jgi:type IV pilus assembly protein PilX
MRRPQAQSGVVLILTLIVLVAMTMAGIALMRSTYSSNLIAGNLAFQRAATQSADAAVEDAVVWLETLNGTTTLSCIANASFTSLMCDQSSRGYTAARADPSSDWATFFGTLTAFSMYSGGVDDAGNQVSYVIQRTCSAAGDPLDSATGCSVSPSAWSSNKSSMGGEIVGLKSNNQTYYRITVQIRGPRSTTSYVQAMVSM